MPTQRRQDYDARTPQSTRPVSHLSEPGQPSSEIEHADAAAIGMMIEAQLTKSGEPKGMSVASKDWTQKGARTDNRAA